MSDFKKLKLPEQSGRGWYIAIDYDKEDTAWLTTTGIITSSTDDMDILFHASELEAHDAAMEYYGGYLIPYPYMASANALVDGGVDVNESQVMEFI